jgi:hypothetical protein
MWTEEYYIMRTLIIYTFTECYYSYRFKEGGVDDICNSYGGGKKYMQIFILKNMLNEKDHLEVLEMNGRIILK